MRNNMIRHVPSRSRPFIQIVVWKFDNPLRLHHVTRSKTLGFEKCIDTDNLRDLCRDLRR
ncbi:hypothetical protein HanIR_Chr11g0552291 [Helianthus annuus]|nr:hypothetical protein HanIR_Chr11g0552291 [Helianthus annuus]